MAEFQATEAQRAAIDVRGRAVLVSAGAGSGKTRVLTERLMGFILDEQNPVDISRFVVITFTQASAAELRSRITEELSRALGQAETDPTCSEKRRSHIRRQQALIRKAPIGTIHHFCSLILREHGHLAGLTSDFKILSEERAASMKEEILERVLDSRYEKMEQYPGFEALVNSVGTGRDDSKLSAVIQTVYDKMQSHPRPEVWAERCIARISGQYEDIGETLWGQELLSGASAIVDYWCGEMDRLLELLPGDAVAAAAYMDAIAVGADSLRELKRSLKLGWEQARNCPNVAFGRMKPIREEKKTVLSEKVKNRKNDCSKAIKKIEGLFSVDSETILAELAQTAPTMEALLQVVLDFDRVYTAEKRSEGLVDYADLEHCAARILTEETTEQDAVVPTELAKSIAQRYTEIMVDEYQDVSRVQETIFRAVSQGERNLFQVGDVKQSIYRFRLADPEIFNRKYHEYAPLKEAQPGEAAKILLQENFRSRREILECANAIFSCCMSRTLGEITYDDAAALKVGATGYCDTVPVPEVNLIALHAPDEDGPEKEKTQQEAAFVAEKILHLVASGEMIQGKTGLRPIAFGDIAILLRSANTVGGIYRKELAKRGIPVVSSQGGGYFESREISFLCALLGVLDNPQDEVELSALLTSPFFGFTADELAAIRARGEDAGFYEALQAAAEEDAKCQGVLDKIHELRALAPDLSVEKLVRRILHTTDILAVCAAMPDGALRTANLMRMIQIAKNFETDGYHGLHRFVLYLARLKKKGTEISAGEVSGNCVQILSIHRSKGLEFPVVFLCDSARRFNQQDSSETVLVHPELGLGPKGTNLELGIQYPTLARKAIAQRLRRETLSEEMRLLYVALTRPKERLFITAGIKCPPDYLEKQRQCLPLSGKQIDPEILSGAKNYIDWITLAALADSEEHLRIQVEEAPAAAGTEPAATENKTGEDAELMPILLELEKNLSFQYPHAEAEKLPSKITATELKHLELLRPEEDQEAEPLLPAKKKHIFRMPDFAQKEKKISAAERGVATHLALQYMDYQRAAAIEGVAEEITRLQEGNFLSQRQAESVNRQAIVKLFRSPLGERIRNADAVHRELRFSLLCDAGELMASPTGEEILLQGVVDCCLEEKGELVILDYKTDRVQTEEEIAARTQLYASQVNAYAQAMERIFGMPVKETILYFLFCGEAVPVKR